MNLAIHFRRYLKLALRRWPILLLFPILGVSYYGYKAIKSPNIYQAVSVIGHAPRVRDSSIAKPQLLEEMSKYYENKIADMQRSAVLQRVAARLTATDPFALQNITLVKADVGQGSSFQMIVRATNFRSATNYAALWAEEFVNFEEGLQKKGFGHSAEETQKEIVKFDEKLRKVRGDIESFLRTNNISSIREASQGTQKLVDELLTQMTGVKTERELLEQSNAETLASREFANPTVPKATRNSDDSGNASDPLSKFSSGTEYRTLKLELLNKQNERETFRQTLKEAHPEMVRLNREISSITNKIKNTLLVLEEERKARIDTLKTKELGLQNTISQKTEQLARSRDLDRQYSRVEDEEKTIKDTLDQLRRDLLRLDMVTGGDEEIFEIREKGVGSPFPVSPNRPKMVLTGLVFGLGAALALIYFLHRLDDRLELAQDIEAVLEEPVLGQIPQVASNTEGGPLLISSLDQHDFFAESIRGIRSAVLFGNHGGNKQVLLVTSAVPGDGKTTFTVNFALTLALAGNRVLLIDADLRRGTSQNFFQRDREPGLSEILRGELHWLDVTQKSPFEGLDLIFTGKLPPNPGELLISPIAQQLVAEVKESYDYVIFDCPPLTGIDDTFSLLGLSDGLLFVVRAGQTSMRFAKTALAAIHHRGARVLGLVLNGITADNPYYYYYTYYHSYYNKEHTPPPAHAANLAPGVTMAAPKARYASIEAEAEARVATKAGEAAHLIGSESKTEFFKARRAARKSVAHPSAPPNNSTAQTNPAPGTQKPGEQASSAPANVEHPDTM